LLYSARISLEETRMQVEDRVVDLAVAVAAIQAGKLEGAMTGLSSDHAGQFWVNFRSPTRQGSGSLPKGPNAQNDNSLEVLVP